MQPVSSGPWVALLAQGAVLAWSLAGMLLLSLGMDRHRPPPLASAPRAPWALQPVPLRLAGSAALLVGLLCAAFALGTGAGTVLWLGSLSAAGLATLALHTWASRQAWPVARASMAAALLIHLGWLLTP